MEAESHTEGSDRLSEFRKLTGVLGIALISPAAECAPIIFEARVIAFFRSTVSVR